MDTINVITLTTDRLTEIIEEAAAKAIERYEARTKSLDYLASLDAIAAFLGTCRQTVIKNYRMGMYGNAIRRNGRKYCASKRELLDAIETSSRELKQYSILS